MKSGAAAPLVNLDAAAAMPMLPGLPDAYAEYLRQYQVNPHGVTCFAARCRQALDNAARRLLKAAGTSEERHEVIWCSSATEALNLAIRGLDSRFHAAVLCDAGGHPALRSTISSLGPGRVLLTEYTPDGSMKIPAGAAECTMAALTLVNSENGGVFDGRGLTLPPGAPMLLDASQGFGIHSLPWHGANPRLAVLSAHKMGASGDTAALLLPRGMKLRPIFSGGGQQGGIRPGTIHVPGALLMADAAEFMVSRRNELLSRYRELNALLRHGISAIGKGAWPIFSPEDASPALLYFAVPGYEGAIVARILAEKHDILTGTGSACSAESRETSPLLRAMGISDDIARCALRLSFHPESTADDVRRFLEIIPGLLKEY